MKAVGHSCPNSKAANPTPRSRKPLNQRQSIYLRSSEQIPLHQINPEQRQSLALFVRLNPFSNKRNAQPLGHQDDTGDDGLANRILVDSPSECHIQLKYSRLKFCE